MFLQVANDCVAFELQVGKGLSKNGKAQKLALQHWLEAVGIMLMNTAYLVSLFLVLRCRTEFCFSFFIWNRLTLDIVMGITSISIMPNGLSLRAENPSFIGKDSSKLINIAVCYH